MARKRDGPYVWVSWITKLLAGEVNCEWAPWFKAHHTYQKVPSDLWAAGGKGHGVRTIAAMLARVCQG